MTAATIKRKLHSYLEVADEKKIKAIYTMMEREIEDSLVDYTDELKAILNKRHEQYKNGKVKMITAKESKQRISKLMTRLRLK